MMFDPLMVRVAVGTSALVLDSPHSGTQYPADFGLAPGLLAADGTAAMTLRDAEDTHVEKLYAFAPEMGASWVEALFPRSYLDANRAPDDIDAALLAEPWPGLVPPASDKVRLGKGLIWRLLEDGTPMYQRKLPVAEVKARIERCWQPYHAAVAHAIRAAHAAHGHCIHLNCHSMPAIASALSTLHPGEAHPDFVIGDRDGTTADRRLTEALRAFLAARGYSVAVNHPYKGVELVRRYGNPAHESHSLQLEINRKLYMDEATRALTPGFEPLRETLRDMVAWLTAIRPRDWE
jgi:N-formylglutamate deformylase